METDNMETINRIEPLRKVVGAWRAAGKRVALVPTMGALHDGHMTLVRRAAELADRVVVSIFVNPLQFGPNEDLAAYPRRMAQDSALLEAAGVAALWAPDVAAMYPEGFSTTISVTGVSEGFCGAARPGHFDGVATVVAKLFGQVTPDVALFGEKDWQQLAVVRRMHRDLDLPFPGEIVGVPTVREADGLAMSSRNAYLSPEERQQAVALPRAMAAARDAIRGGAPVAESLAALHAALLAGGFRSVDYADLADAETLTLLDTLGRRDARLLVAARIGSTRLIDNIPV